MSDSWLFNYDACSRQGQEILEKLQERAREPKGSSNHAKLSAHLRAQINQFSNDVNSLREGLVQAATRRQITAREVERRQIQLDELLTKEKRINLQFKNEGPSVSNQRGNLLGDVYSPADPWAEQEDMDIAGIRAQQQTVIAEQDQGLDALSNILARQKQMGLDIGNEIEYQNELIDDIADGVDRTDQRLIRETKHIRIVDRKSGACCLWVIAAFLFVAIVVFLFVPYGKHKI